MRFLSSLALLVIIILFFNSEIKSELPLGESLKDVVSRVKSTYQQILSLSIEKKVTLWP